MLKKILPLSFLVLFLSLTLNGCYLTFPWEKEREPLTLETSEEEKIGAVIDDSYSGDLRKFQSEEILKSFLVAGSRGGGLSASWLLAETGYGLIDEANLNAVANNQEQIFSSADIIKYDSGYIYALVKNDLFIISTQPAADAKIVSRISFSTRPIDLVVAAGRLAVLGNDGDLKNTDLYRSFKRKSDYTFLKVYDVFNPANPKEIRSFYFEGGYSGLRLADDYIYLLTASPAYFSENDPLTPRIIENNKVISGDCLDSKDCTEPIVYYFDHPYLNYNYLSLTSINLADRNEPINNQLFLVDSSYSFNISSAGNLYLSRFSSLTTYDLEQKIQRDKIFPKLSQFDQNIIQKIESSPDYILSATEKKIKVTVLLSRYLATLTEAEKAELQTEIDGALLAKIKQHIDDLEKTDIYKFSLKSGQAVYQARGQVLGQILNRLALNEKEGNLHVVTVRSRLWSMLFEESDKYYSSVYVLDNALKSVGALENIATSQELFEARFLGDRIYLSTTDSSSPVYVVSLENESEPKIVGAIKINNLALLHSFDKLGRKILGFGREGSDGPDGNRQALKLSLFDFSDLKAPKELSGYLIGDLSSESAALKDYRSFTFLPEKKTLVLPATLKENGLLTFSGALVFDTDKDVFTLKGRVDHLYGSNFSHIDYWRGFSYYDNAVKRSFIIDNYLFTFSSKYIRINNLSDLSDVKTISLAPEAERIFIPRPVTPTEKPSEMLEEAALNEEQTAPNEEQVAPNEEQTAPTEEQTAPTEEQTAPTEEQAAPTE